MMPGTGPTSAAACKGGIPAAPAYLRRLQPEEYVNTVRELMTAPTAAPQLEPPVGKIISQLEVEKLSAAAAELVATKGHLTFAPCDVAGAQNSMCADSFIAAFGRVAFRRPLDTAEKTWLRGVYDQVRGLQVTPPVTFRESLDTVAQVMLQSPQLLYIRDEGVVDRSLPAGVRRLTGYERATRLSYLFWSSTPDKSLLDAAEKGQLDSADGVRVQAERLVASPRARKMVKQFASSWLELDGNASHPNLESFEKDKARFSYDSAALRTAWRNEVESLYDRVFFEQGGSFSKLMTSTESYVTAALAKMYGVTGGPTTGSAWVNLNPMQRGGLFTRAASLAVQSTADTQDPIHRGVYVFRHVMCQPLPDPPVDVDNTPPKPLPGQKVSTRQLVDIKTGGGVCVACHSVVNPIGFTLENYDAMGAWQTTEKLTASGVTYTVPIDSTATIPATDLAGTTMGGVGLSQRLAASAQARDCAVQGWFEKALARAPGDADTCLVDQLKTRFKKNDDLRDLVLAIASSDAALFIKEVTP